jgi:hypothetical protein
MWTVSWQHGCGAALSARADDVDASATNATAVKSAALPINPPYVTSGKIPENL